MGDDAVPLAAKGPCPVVALEAQGKGNGTFQEPRVHRAVGAMTGLAAVDAHAGMLKNKRSAFLDVALQAGLLVPLGLGGQTRALAHAPGRRVGTVRIVTIGTLHDAFVHPVFEGHRELGAHLSVAIPAEIDLLLREEKFRRG